ncbi:nucleotide-binding domain-containing protein [Mycena pura]|uniref:Nucleotide-binding domain-containing protein n=1 Tax=Mycena pura TaxID=153505 RepID=A0AAD7E1X2_9AGAR|nr:nucleotide-binding domain-containing protein [Mycena pura]
MGASLSRLRLLFKSLRAITAAYQELSRRIKQSPGIPASGPTTPYWTMPASQLARHGSDANLPAYADVLIIGSGITGTAFARTLLSLTSKDADVVNSPQVVMLEARDACSGATARNGGHITPPLYHDYRALKEAHGAERAKEIIRFRLAHLAELLQVSREENIDDSSQCRTVETFDMFFDAAMFEVAVRNLAIYLDEMPEQRKLWRVVSADECIKDLQFSPTVVGAIATTAGAIHPYRFVTGILTRLLARHPKNFHLFTHTPCLSISSPPSSKASEPFYTVFTKNGVIRTRHIVHATNAWASHLLSPMRGKIVPVRGHMSAQRPGMGLGRVNAPLENTSFKSASDSVLTLTDNAGTSASNSWLGTRSFIMHSNGKYDYLTQQPTGSACSSSFYPPPDAEFMFGGGAAHGEIADEAFMHEIGVADDRDCDLDTGAYLGGALSMYFSGWGAEGRDSKCTPSLADGKIDSGRMKKLWSGILGISADGRPWVGRLPAKMTGRPVPKPKASSPDTSQLAAPGEWISAGYSGEGMVHAFLSGKALAHMVLGNTADKLLPELLLVTEARWKKANLEDLIRNL